MTLRVTAPTLPVEQGFAGAKARPRLRATAVSRFTASAIASPPPCFNATLRTTRIEWRFR
ncbi:hypothetical protein BCEP4_630086 [Burkholderia cepacia]|nr:hypothetical protein BCEP4_630086 [Burkholderia cepacia]